MRMAKAVPRPAPVVVGAGRFLRLAAAVVAAGCVGGLAALAAESPVPWKTDARFRQELDVPIGVRWSSNPLRRALTNLSRNQGVAIFLDRRVDPDQKIEFAADNTPVRSVIDGVANQLQLGTCHVGPVVYVGPPETTAVLGTVAALQDAAARSLPAAVRTRVIAAQPWSWPELSTPRELAEQCVSRVGLRIEDSAVLPHDLWPAVDLPALTFAQRLSLILAGFGLTFEYAADGAAVRLVPLPATAVLERRYSVRNDPEAVAAHVRQRFPAARVTPEAGKLLVVGPLEAHEAVEDLVRGTVRKTIPSQPSPKSTVVYTLRIENKPLGGIATAVAKRVNREIRFDPRVHPKLQELISFEVKNATLEELLKAMLAPAGLGYRLDDTTLTVVPLE